MDAEFKEGQLVTFKPYKNACKCVVKGVQKGMWFGGKHMNGDPDDRIFYILDGEARTTTTGKSIVESKLYEPPIFDFDVSYDLLRRIPKERREISNENYRWILDNVSMTSVEVLTVTDAYNDQKVRYKVRES